MKKHSKILRSLLAIVMVILMVGSVVPTVAFAAKNDSTVSDVSGYFNSLKDFLQKIKDFFQQLIDFFKNLFNGNEPEEPEYPEGAVVVKNTEELQQAITVDGAYIVLAEDIILDSSSTFTATNGNGSHLYLYHVNVTLDLNGHDIIVPADAVMEGKTEATALFLVQYSTLNIIGEGNIVTENKAIPVYGWAHSEINIYGGTFKTNAHERTESAVYVNNPNVTINVYGGTYTETPFAFNSHNSKCGSTPVIILYEGVTFKDYKNHTMSDYNAGRTALEEGCYFQETVVDGETIYTVAKI